MADVWVSYYSTSGFIVSPFDKVFIYQFPKALDDSTRHVNVATPCLKAGHVYCSIYLKSYH